MPTKFLKFKCPEFYNLSMVCHSHGWIDLAPFSWDKKTNTIQLTLRVANKVIDVAASQKSSNIRATIQSFRQLDSATIAKVTLALTRSLGLDGDISGLLKTAETFGSEYKILIKKGAGRLLRAPSLWEDAAKTLFTTNCTWALTKKMCAGVCSEKFSKKSPGGSFPFPGPKVFIRLTGDELRKLIPVGYRAEYLISLAQAFVKDPCLRDIETDSHGSNTAYDIVCNLKGFGPYASTHMLVLCGYFERIPVDTVVLSYLNSNFRFKNPRSFIKRHYKNWGQYKWWGFKFEKMLKRN